MPCVVLLSAKLDQRKKPKITKNCRLEFVVFSVNNGIRLVFLRKIKIMYRTCIRMQLMYISTILLPSLVCGGFMYYLKHEQECLNKYETKSAKCEWLRTK